MTWKHDRGLAPMLATAVQFAASHPDVHIEWEARSLQGFADHPIRDLAQEFDLLVLDHPFMGTVAKGGYLVPLDNYIAPEVLSSLRSESVGACDRRGGASSRIPAGPAGSRGDVGSLHLGRGF